MGLFSRGWTILWVALGMAGFSQAPEFTQQYKQRLGGGIAELKSVVDQFDEDAQGQGLTRETALAALKESGEDFPRVRGQSMETVISRYGNLVSQRAALEKSDPFFEPVNLLRWPDTEILSGTFNDFKPGLQFTPQGLLWALFGGVLLGGLGRLPFSLAGMGGGNSHQKALDANTEPVAEAGPSVKGDDVDPLAQQGPTGSQTDKTLRTQGDASVETSPVEQSRLVGENPEAQDPVLKEPIRNLISAARDRSE